MTRRARARTVGTGCAAVLAARLLAVGCSEDGQTFLVGAASGSGFPGSSVAQNNLAPDGAG